MSKQQGNLIISLGVSIHLAQVFCTALVLRSQYLTRKEAEAAQVASMDVLEMQKRAERRQLEVPLLRPGTTMHAEHVQITMPEDVLASGTGTDEEKPTSHELQDHQIGAALELLENNGPNDGIPDIKFENGWNMPSDQVTDFDKAEHAWKRAVGVK